MYSVLNSVSERGIGLFSGKLISLTLSSSPYNGIWFKNQYGCLSELSLDNIQVTNHNTSILFKDGTKISVIEHLLAAIYSFGISKILISVDSDEVPLFDGSSSAYILLLKELSLRRVENISIGVLKKKISVFDGSSYIKASPSNKLILDYTIKFKEQIIGTQRMKYNFSKKSFIEDISMARTFGIVSDLKAAQEAYKGATLKNTLIIMNDKLLSKERIDNEFVKHKVLDALGDLQTIGYPILMKYKSVGGSHKLNNLLLNKIIKENALSFIMEETMYKESEQLFLNNYSKLFSYA